MDSPSGARGLSVPGPAVQIYCACVNAPVTDKTIKPAAVPHQKSSLAFFHLAAKKPFRALEQKLRFLERNLITVSLFLLLLETLNILNN